MFLHHFLGKIWGRFGVEGVFGGVKKSLIVP